MQSNRKSHLVLVRMGNALPILEESFMSFLTKLNVVLLYDWATALLYIYLPHLKFYVQKKNLYTIIDSSIILNCQNMEALIFQYVNGWIYCDISYNGIPLSNLRNEPLSKARMWMSAYCLVKSSIVTLYTQVLFMWHSEESKTTEMINR